MKLVIIFSTLLVTLLAFQNCSPEHQAGTLPSQSELAAVTGEAKSILVNKCMSCHGPSASIVITPDLEALAESGLIVMGEPQNSTLYLQIIDRVEPPSDSGVTLTDNEIEVIRKWIKGPSALNYVEHIRPILETSCNTCHGGGGRRLSTYDDLMRNSRVVPGDLEASTLWQRIISTEEGVKMPPQGKSLSSEDLQIISDWITSGAKEFE